MWLDLLLQQNRMKRSNKLQWFHVTAATFSYRATLIRKISNLDLYSVYCLIFQFIAEKSRKRLNYCQYSTLKKQKSATLCQYPKSILIAEYSSEITLLYFIILIVQMGDCMSSNSGSRLNHNSNRSGPHGAIKTISGQAPTNTSKQTLTQPHVKVQIHKMNNLNPILKPIFPKSLTNPQSNPHLAGKITIIPNEFIQIKTPKDFTSWTEFQWAKQPKYQIPAQIAKQPSSFMRSRSFQEKYTWFRQNLEKLRIPWSSGKSQYLEVDRSNLLMSSNAQFEAINFHKEVKIVFKDEKEASDAGGLIRQWMNLCINEIFSPELRLLSLCQTSATYYKFNYSQFVQQLFQAAAKILGIVIGKAIFERIPLKCFLNYTVWRQICSQPIQMNDVFTYDSDFYRGWLFMIQNTYTTALEQNFCVYQFDEHGTQSTIPLKENGFHIMVNSSNKEEYITLMCQHYCTKSVIKLIDNLRYGIYKIIPPDLLSVFQPQELDMIINGKKEIDLKDLKQNVQYTGCQPNDKVVEWFWQYVESFSMLQLENLLHFVTGNGRVPILGFKYLQSNRGQFQKFQIKQVPYDDKSPYPKSHTCFNRLELPLYPTKQLFDKNIVYVSVENKYFGLE